MEYLDKRPHSVACIRKQYEEMTGNQPHVKGSMFVPNLRYTKWLELQLSAKCVDVYLNEKETKSIDPEQEAKYKEALGE